MIYLDYNATTPVDEAVLQVMLPYFSQNFGNAASVTHIIGKKAKDAVEKARSQVSGLLGCTPQEITFTSGATEAINLAIKGVAEIYAEKGKHIVTMKTEHRAVLDTCKSLEKKGYKITYLDVNEEGLLEVADLENSIRTDTILVSVMWVNNETGVIQPMEKIAEVVHAKNCLLMSDATQAIGKVDIDLERDRIDLLTLSAHKFYGPKGVGALYTRRKNPRVTLTAQMDGGGHESGKRSGTLNVPGIVGLGAASELARKEMKENENRIRILREKLEKNLLEMGDFKINSSLENRLYNVSNICFKGIDGAKLLRSAYSWLAISSGSACSSADAEPSHVLRAMGLSEKDARSSMRVSLGKYTTEEEINKAIEKFSKTIKELS